MLLVHNEQVKVEPLHAHTCRACAYEDSPCPECGVRDPRWRPPTVKTQWSVRWPAQRGVFLLTLAAAVLHLVLGTYFTASLTALSYFWDGYRWSTAVNAAEVRDGGGIPYYLWMSLVVAAAPWWSAAPDREVARWGAAITLGGGILLAVCAGLMRG